MTVERKGQVAVIFITCRTAADVEGYAAAAASMEALAAAQPGYRGIDSVRAADGLGITVSYWADQSSALAWRDHRVHAETRAEGRARWYEWYRVIVTTVDRDYAWTRP